MQKRLNIYIDRLKGGTHFPIEEGLDPYFIEVQEAELSFQQPIQLRGSAYLAGDHLIIQLSIQTQALLPCIVCNEQVEIGIKIESFYQTVPLSSIKSAIYDYGDEVRNAILLQVPTFIECHHGNCPERVFLKKYLE